MKAAKFEYKKTNNLVDALSALSTKGGDCKILAGSQSLGPMMNLRLARPDRLIDIRALSALQEVKQEPNYLFVGALVTHANIEDGALPDVTQGMMTHVAAGIAYRAVRNRGTIGGSLVHADPAGDWPTALRALGAYIVIDGPTGPREVTIDTFQLGAFTVSLEENEIVRGVRVPILSNAAQWGYHKISRKPGEYAESIGAYVCDPSSGIARLILSGTDGAPMELVSTAKKIAQTNGVGFDFEAARVALTSTGEVFEPFKLRMHAVALHRAVVQAYGA